MKYNEVKLEELCEIKAGGTPSRSKKEYWDNGDIPWIKIGDINNKYVKNASEYITVDGLNNSSAKLLRKGTILYTIFATVGEVAILDIDATTNQAIVGLSNNEKIDTDYLYYFLKSQKDKVLNIGRGVAQNNINISILKALKVPMPDKNVQFKISEVLDKAQELIDKRKEQIEALDELVKSKFSEMFKDLKELEHLSLAKCCNFIDYRGKTPILSENGIRIINAKSVGNGFFKYIDEYISEETYNSWMRRGFPTSGDVLFVTEGHTFGNVCRIPSDLEKFAMGQRVITIQGNKELLNNTFLSQYMQTMPFKIEIDKYKTGSSAQGIRSKELQKILVPIPNIQLQNQFAEFVKQVDKLKFKMENSLKELEDNFNSLMQKAFKGELFKED
ncbi:restriction endonuclease subunit S [Clostridium baratii]|uniref:restriction endonuclease subunit S n=1 Tax=Clostridium baratii TaxID=1561 RepID=UPI0006BAE9A3|nr:restriction endonuclease subunit S [Clostridium baratii]STB00554.1 type I restriction-modification system subunit S [Clostridium baratii]